MSIGQHIWLQTGLCPGVGFCECTESKPTCCKDSWQLVMTGSRFLKSNEDNWEPVEGEA